MKIMILGAAGFIGTNLAIQLAGDQDNGITLADKQLSYFDNLRRRGIHGLEYLESSLDRNMDFSILAGQDTVYHLVSTNMPTTSNQHISQDVENNVMFSSDLFDACIKYGVKKVVFISSGGTVYGKEARCPLPEDTPTNPISSYGVQKIMIEKLLYLYHYMYGLDYRIIRLSNPYGPYQRPNGKLGAVTTFTYQALKGEEIRIYGDGSVVRDYIFIDDAIRGIIRIANGTQKYRTFNLGCGYGTSITQLLATIEQALGIKIKKQYTEARKVDVPVNFLDISRFEECYGKLDPIRLEEGIKRTAAFLEKEMI